MSCRSVSAAAADRSASEWSRLAYRRLHKRGKRIETAARPILLRSDCRIFTAALEESTTEARSLVSHASTLTPR